MSLGREKETNSLLRDLDDGLLAAELAFGKVHVLCRDLSDDFFDFRDVDKTTRTASVMYSYNEAAIKNDVMMDYLAELKQTLKNLQTIVDELREKRKEVATT